MWKIAGKLALAVVIFLGLNFFISIPVGLIGTVIAMAGQGQDVSPESIVELMSTNPILRTVSYTLSAFAGLGAALIMYSAMERDRSWALGWRQPAWFGKGALGLLLGAVLICASYGIVLAFGGIRIADTVWTSEVFAALGQDLIIFIAVAIGEEVFTRGYIYGLVRRHGGIALAVLVSSVIFALLHSMNAAVFSNVFPMLNLALAGIMLALFREWSGGLWVPIGVHLTWNFFQGDVLGMAVSGIRTPSIVRNDIIDPFIAGGGFGLEGSFAATIVTAAVSVLLWQRIRSGSSRQA